MSAPTIPAAHLEALGFRDDDQPVQTSTGLPVGRWQWDIALKKDPRMLLAVEQSMGTLLRALSRQYGAKLNPGEVPQWYEDRDGGWWMISGNSEEQGFVPPGHSDDGSGFAAVVPALARRMTGIDALTEAIAWLVSR